MRAAPRPPVLPLAPRGVPLRRPEHPGRFLNRHCLMPLGISQSAAARLLGISRRRVSELVLGQRAMSADTAIRCALAFGVDAGFWLQLQARWDSYHHWRELRERMREGRDRPVQRPAGG
ncbi:HigA family addiction module antitoxin [Sphaerotilus natans]|uniref:HigA family addiction module antitoxin n=1 Tax=Sphaerotilus natans TaxID=34103 RepID=UPI00406CBBEF